jgi:CHAT domain-containing protein
VAKSKHLFVEPDGDLEQIPFEALIDQAGNYVGDRFALSNIPGVRYLEDTNLPRGINKESRAFVVGDPRSEGWDALPDAGQEAQDIASLFQNAKLSLRESPDAQLLARELAHADVFHFSGHAVAASTGAGLVFGSSGLLDGKALDTVDLRQVQLVVLSACVSARGTTGRFDDGDSLARSFLVRGIPDVVASRWMVESAVTAPFIKNFYAHLLSGGNVSQALQISARTVRAKAETSHPYFWAGFAVFGRG